MKKNLVVATVVIALFFSMFSSVKAADVSSVVEKEFKDREFPHNPIIVQLKIVTEPNYLSGDRAEKAQFVALGVIEKAERMIMNEGWRKTSRRGSAMYRGEVINAGEIYIATDEGMAMKFGKGVSFSKSLRMMVFFDQCEAPFNYAKLRGDTEEDVSEFWRDVVSRVEECILDAENLE